MARKNFRISLNAICKIRQKERTKSQTKMEKNRKKERSIRNLPVNHFANLTVCERPLEINLFDCGKKERKTDRQLMLKFICFHESNWFFIGMYEVLERLLERREVWMEEMKCRFFTYPKALKILAFCSVDFFPFLSIGIHYNLNSYNSFAFQFMCATDRQKFEWFLSIYLSYFFYEIIFILFEIIYFYIFLFILFILAKIFVTFGKRFWDIWSISLVSRLRGHHFIFFLYKNIFLFYIFL